MRLTAEENREAIKRYRHVKPARIRGADACPSMCPGTVRTCSQERGHRGPHVAHGLFRKVVAVWDGEARSATRRSGPAGKGDMGTRSRGSRGTHEPVGPLRALLDRVLGPGSSLESVIFLVMLVAFVAFAIHWFLLFTGAI